MFQGLIEKILKRLFGKFIPNIDSKKLKVGIWSGEVVIENVSLTPELFQMLGLPYSLVYSLIQKLVLKIPWRSLSSNPVEISLESMLVLVRALPKEEWKVDKQTSIQLILNDVNASIKKYLDSLIETEKAQNKVEEKGMLDNIYIRVLDNLQFSIKNIHVRYQDSIQKQYSFGITLDSVEAHTSDKEGQKKFLDRTSKSKEILFKTIHLNNLGFYWREYESQFLFEQPKDKIVKRLLETIYKKDRKSQINYSLMINLKGLLKQRGEDDLDGPTYQVQFKVSDLRIKVSKLIIQQLIKFLQFRSDYSSHNLLRVKSEIPPSFKQLFKKYYSNYQKRQINQFFTVEEHSLFIDTLVSVRFQKLEEVIEERVRQSFEKSVTSRMFNKSRSILEKDQQDELQAYMAKIYQSKLNLKIPPNYIFLQMRVQFSELSFILDDEYKKNLISATLYEMVFISSIAQSQSIYQFHIRDIRAFGKDDKDIIWRGNRNEQVLDLELIVDTVPTHLKVRLGSICIFYDPKTVDAIKKFLQFQAKVDLRNKARDRVESIKLEVNKNISKNKENLNLSITIQPFQVLLPDGPNMWTLSLGQLSVEKQDMVTVMRISDSKTVYKSDKEIHNCIPQFSILAKINSEDSIELSVQKFKVRIDKTQLQSLRSVVRMISSTTNKAEILNKSTKKAVVFLKENGWKKCLVSICDSYLYFWEKKEYPLGYIRIRKVFYTQGGNKANTIWVGDSNKNHYVMSFEDTQKMAEWLLELEKISMVESVDDRVQTSLVVEEQALQLRLRVVVDQLQFSLVNQLSEDWIRMNVRDSVISIQNYTLNTRLDVSVGNLQCYYQEQKILSKQSSLPFLSFSNWSMSQHHEDYNKQDQGSSIKVSQFQFVYHPVCILRILSFIESSTELEEGIVDEQTMDKQSEERILSRTDVVLQGATIVFVNKKTQISIGLLEIGKADVNIWSTYYYSVKEGVIENIRIFDLSNYPQTIFNDHNKQPNPTLLWGSENGKLSFNLKNYQSNSKHIIDSKYNLLDLQVEGVVLHYIHQPIMRIIDYLLVQVLGVITTPDFFQQYSITRISSLSKQVSVDIGTHIKRKQETLKNKMLNFLGKEKVRINLNNPKDYHYNIKFKASKIIIPSQKEKGMVVSVDQVGIDNEFFFSRERVKHQQVEHVLCERYKFQFLNCQFRILSQAEPITNVPFDILIALEAFFKESEYKFVYEQEIELDNSYHVSLSISPIVISISKAEYFEIMKCMKMNISFDDGLDFIMIHDYIEEDPVPLNIQLYIEHLDLYLDQQSESMIEELHLTYKTSKTLESSFELIIHSIQSRFNEDGVYKQIVSKRKNIQKHNSSNRPSTSFYSKYCPFDTNKKKMSDCCLQYSKINNHLGNITKVTTNQLALIFNPVIVAFGKDFINIPEILTEPKVYFRTKTLVSSMIVEKHTEQISVSINRNIFSFPVPNSDILMNLCISCGFNTNLNDDYKLAVSYCEIFSCNIEAMGAEDLSAVRRRTLVSPFKLDVGVSIKREKKFADFAMSKTILKFSINDMKNLYLSIKELQKLPQFNPPNNPRNTSSNQERNSEVNIIGKIEEFQCLLVNDTNRKYIPVLYLNIKSSKRMEINKVGGRVHVAIDSLGLFAMYFNLKISVWEPVIEKTALNITLSYDPTQQSESTLSVDSYLTLDISTSMLQTILKTLQDVELALSSKIIQDNEDSDHINSWIIYNHTGYEIQCSHNNKSIRIQNSEKNQLYIKTSKEHSIIDSNIPNVYIQMAIPQKKVAFNNLSIGAESIQKLNVNESGLTHPLYKSIKIDISKNIKYVYFYSPVLLLNNTTLNFYLQFANFKGIDFPPGATRAIPYDNLEVKGALILNEDVSELFCVSQLIESSTLSIAHSSIMVHTKTQDIIKNISLEPPYRFTNLIPMDMFINIKVHDRFYSLSLKAFDKVASSQTFYDKIQASVFSFYLDGTQILWSQYSPLVEGVLSLQDSKGRRLPFNVKISKSHQTTNYIFYPLAVLENRSEESIIFTASDKSKLGGQSEEVPTDRIIIDSTDYIRIRAAFQYNYSIPIKLKQESTQFYLSLNKDIDGSAIKIFINMVLLCTNISSPLGINYNQYTLFSKYILYNNTGQELIIRHADAFTSETIMLENTKHTNMYWFNQEYDKLIRLTMNKRNWEWSGPLNIEKPGTTYFILRDRSLFKKLLYMVLNVVILNGRNKIELTVIQDESEYPFKIVNNSENVNVYIPSFRESLKEDQSTYFSWDDPIKQMYTIQLVLQHSNQSNSFKQKRIYINQKKVQNQIIEIKAAKGYFRVIVEIKTLLHQKIITIKDQISEEPKRNWFTTRINLPVAIAFINNSRQHTFHLLSIYSKIQFSYKMDLLSNSKEIDLNLKQLQIDNNTKTFVYYPVVLKTNVHVRLAGSETWEDAEINIDTIKLKLEQDFIYQCYAVYLMLIDLMPKDEGHKSSFSISRIKLPKIVAQLQIQTHQLSLETPVQLEPPDEISYPWETFPYPIKSLVVSLLSSLSISPISFISSLHEGIINLFNDTSSSRGMESFFSKIIGSVSNGINGLVRILVGDLERIDNFVDGVESGVAVFFRTTFSSLNPLVQQPTIGGLFKTAANFVYKPVAGVLRLTLKISEGIKNTAKFSFDEGDVQSRKRNPIVFFGKEQCYRQYNPASSEILSLVSKIHNGSYKTHQLVYFTILSQTQIQSVIVVTSMQTIHFSLQNKKVYWVIPFSNIRDLKIREKGVQIWLNENSEYFTTKNPVIAMPNNSVGKEFFNSLINCIKTYK